MTSGTDDRADAPRLRASP